MTLLIPSATIAARWHGALQERLKCAPLEAFMRAHSLKFATAGAACHTDNIATTTHFFVAAALAEQHSEQGHAVPESQYLVMAHVACTAAIALAHFIDRATCWRIAALLSVGQVLTASVGMRAAAHAAAIGVRDFESRRRRPMQNAALMHIGERVLSAVTRNEPTELRSAAHAIARQIAARPNSAGGNVRVGRDVCVGREASTDLAAPTAVSAP